MTTYLFSILMFIIFLLSNYLFLINKFFFFYINYIVLFTLIFLPIIFYSIVEIRMFLAYTSMFHIIIILIIIIVMIFEHRKGMYIAAHPFLEFIIYC